MRERKGITQNKNKTKEKLFIFFMLLIPLTHFIIFWVYVNLNSILMAFQWNDKTGMPQWSFHWFEEMWKDVRFNNSTLLISLRNTMIFFTTNIGLILPVAILICYFLYKRVIGYRFFRIVFYLPSIISASILVVAFKYIIAIDGPFGIFLTKVIGGEPIAFLQDSDYALKTILFYTITFGFGGNIVLLSGAMSSIPQEVLEAGKIDGVGMFGELFRLVIPLIWPTVSTLIIFAFVGMFNASGPILLFTEGKFETSTLSWWIYEKVYASRTYNYPAAVGLVLTAIGTPIALLVRHLLNRKEVEL